MPKAFRFDQSGRSMVEMLGTLAIIGVLSIGGIMGYSYAMDKYRANEVMNDVNLRGIDLIAQASRGGDLSLDEWPTKTVGDYGIGLEVDTATNATEGGIYVDKVPQRVCEIIGDGLVPNNVDFTVNGADYTGSCSDENKIVFYYGALDEILGNSNEPCNGPIVDGKCEPCKYPYVYNGTNCKGCPEGYTYFGDIGYGSCYDEETLEGLCPENTVYVYTYGITPYPICSDCPDNAISCSNGVAICPEGTQFYTWCFSGHCDTKQPDYNCYKGR